VTGPQAERLRLDPAAWTAAHEELVATLRDLVRIPSVNPPPPEAPDGERRVAEYLAAALADVGLRPEVAESVPGRASVFARLHGDGTGGEPLLLLSHLDVVPAPTDGWTHDPFGADVADGYVWGRGTVDMKQMVAMELMVVRLLARAARAAGRDPGSDPVPGLRRDVLFCSTADEEAGGHLGAGWLVEHRPDWLRAAAAINECGGVSFEIAGRRFYPIQVAEKGYVVYRLTVRGTWGHGSMPRPDNAAVLAARIVDRLAEPLPARVTPVLQRAIDQLRANLPGPLARRAAELVDPDPRRAERAAEQLCDPSLARALGALLRDTISPNVIRAGVKYNVVPGEATIELDCRTLPGTDEATLRAAIRERLGPELAAACEIEPINTGRAVEAPLDDPLYELLERTLRDHDPDGVPLPAIAPWATDAKHTAKLGVPTYGFAPLRLPSEERFLERFHGVDERVSLEALRFGLPVLYDVVVNFAGG
jgi:acetylornithine deacetylase/succinyl-diaminopimelate desuccinylase-like protein